MNKSLEKEDNDTMRMLCVQQGYVTPKCKLNGFIILALIQKGENPCLGCNIDRSECGSTHMNKSLEKKEIK